MTPETKKKALEKLHGDHEQDRLSGQVARLFGASTSCAAMRWAISLRANDFEIDRQLHKIGKPVDQKEWRMSRPR